MIRRSAIQRKISYMTTLAGGQAACMALQHEKQAKVRSLQQLHKGEGYEQSTHDADRCGEIA